MYVEDLDCIPRAWEQFSGSWHLTELTCYCSHMVRVGTLPLVSVYCQLLQSAMEFSLSRWYEWQFVEDDVKAGFGRMCFGESAHNARHLAMLASVAMAVSCMRGQSWVKSSYGKRFPTVEGQEAHRLDHVRVVAFVIPDPRQSSCVWPRQNRYLRVSWDTRLRFLHTCWPTSVTAVLTLVPRPHACDQIFAAFQKTFYAHLQTLICGACFLRAAHAWPEEILRKAGPLKFRAVHHAFYGTGDAVAWCVSFLLAWSVSVAAS